MRQKQQYTSLVAVLGVAIVAGASLLLGCKKSEPVAQPDLPEAAVAVATPSKKLKADLHQLEGRWLRPDVGYTLDIRKVASDGKLDVAYSAPRLVQVGKAVATQANGKINVSIELQDPSLAGSKYTLTFDAQAQRLNGVYFQAALGESLDIFFVRMQ